MSKPKVLYISDCGLENGIFPSQVTGMVRAWCGIADTTLLYRRKRKRLPDSEGINAFESPRTPNIARALWRVETIAGSWRKKVGGYDLLHCRGAISVWMALQSMSSAQRKRTKIVLDVRGAGTEEFDNTSIGFARRVLRKIREHEYRGMEAEAMKRSDMIVAVSQALSEYLNSNYGRSADVILPPIVDGDIFRFSQAKREEKRHELGFAGKSVFLFVGGTVSWQRLDHLGNWWKGRSSGNSNDVLLVLTHNPVAFIESSGLTKEEAAGSVIVKSVPYKEVPAYLCAADTAMLFRDDSVTNLVASPVKLSEYLSMGLRVVTNQKNYAAMAPDCVTLSATGNYSGISLPPADTKEQRAAKSGKYSSQLSGKRAVQIIRDHALVSGEAK